MTVISRYYLNSDECELLLAFEQAPSLSQVSQIVGRDISAISRVLTRIVEKAPVITKQGNRWQLTELGRRVNVQTRDSMTGQNYVLSETATLRIGTNREFASQVIAPDLPRLMEIFPKTLISIHTYEGGTEQPLLNGQIDLAIDCDRPFDSGIAFQNFLNEPMKAVCSQAFWRKYRKHFAENDTVNVPHLHYTRIPVDHILTSSENRVQSVAQFNDIACVRAACISGAGWALLPAYTVKEALQSGDLVSIPMKALNHNTKYGIWWLRHQPSIKKYVTELRKWMSTKSLEG
jgi:DNA-binding transcriptional LysR family regulator